MCIYNHIECFVARATTTKIIFQIYGVMLKKNESKMQVNNTNGCSFL